MQKTPRYWWSIVFYWICGWYGSLSRHWSWSCQENCTRRSYWLFEYLFEQVYHYTISCMSSTLARWDPGLWVKVECFDLPWNRRIHCSSLYTEDGLPEQLKVIELLAEVAGAEDLTRMTPVEPEKSILTAGERLTNWNLPWLRCDFWMNLRLIDVIGNEIGKLSRFSIVRLICCGPPRTCLCWAFVAWW